jgi:GNAT superfamily N-acetyltransferase
MATEQEGSKSKILVRAARPDDIDALAQFQLDMAKETENLDLDPALVKNGVSRPFAEPALAQYFVAEVDGQLAGMLMVTNEWSDWRCGIILWIQSVFTAKPYRGIGVFKSLYAHVKTLCESSDRYCGIRLYVETENLRAQEVYKRLGMQVEHYHMMKWMKTTY